MESIRLLLAAGPAGLVTLTLFHLMQSLIDVPSVCVTDSIARVVDFVSVRVDSAAPPPRSQRPIKPRVESAPTPPGPPTGEGTGRDGLIEIAKAIDPIGQEGRTGPLLGAADGEAVPLIRVQPQYPQRALVQRREGRVLVELSIAANGAVTGARVIAAEPAGMFEDAALAAVAQWKYSPRVENGRAVAQRGVRTTIVFRLENARS